MIKQEKLIKQLQLISEKTALTVLIIGSIVMIGWILNIPILKSVIPGLVTMKANTSLAFILAGSFLWLFHQSNKEKIKLLAQIAASMVLLIGLLTLFQYIFKINLGIDELLFKEPVNAVATSTPGRMAINTAFNFFLTGISLLLIISKKPKYKLIQTLNIIILLIAFLGLLGYIYGNTYFYQLGKSFTAMALHTAIAFILSCVSMLFIRPDKGFISVLTMENAGGILARRLSLAAIIIPPLVCWFILLGYRQKSYTAEMAICLLGILHVVIFSALIWWNAKSIGMIDNKRFKAEKALQKINEELEQIVEERTNQLVQANHKLEQAFFELQHTQSQLVQTEKMSSLGQLVAGVAHEINNPVNFIYGNLIHVKQYTNDMLELLELYHQEYTQPSSKITNKIEDIELDFLQEDLPKMLTSMQVGAERITEIVKSLRNFSRMDEAEMKPVNIHDGIDSTLMILHNRLKAKPEHPSIEIIKDYENLPLVQCYAGHLNQVFMNLISNAIDAIDEYNHHRSFVEIKANPSQIKITTRKVNNDMISISIADNGPGLSAENVNKIFDPFFTTKPIGKGTGLGLAISYQIVVEKHGGKLTCISESGSGAEFLIEIPVSQVPSQVA